MKKRILTIIAILTVLLQTACDDIFTECESGLGSKVEQELNLDDFHRINLQSGASVFIQKGEQQSVLVEGQQNLISLLDTRVQNGEWNINYRRCVNNSNDLTIYITVPSLDVIQLSGSGTIVMQDQFSADNVELDISGSGNVFSDFSGNTLYATITGSGNINVEGNFIHNDLRVSGSGNIDTFNSPVSTSRTRITGSGTIKVDVVEELDARISGSGDIIYRGNPSITQSISGSGNLINAN